MPLVRCCTWGGETWQESCCLSLRTDKGLYLAVMDRSRHTFAPPGSAAIVTACEARRGAKTVPSQSSSAALTASSFLWGSVSHHVEREASRFIPSMLRGGVPAEVFSREQTMEAISQAESFLTGANRLLA